MKKDKYITDEERKKCRKVANAFAGLEEENIMVVDVGKFGFLRLFYYKYPYGFDNAILYSDSKQLFDDLWQDWLYEQLQKIAKENPYLLELDYEDVFKELPEEKQKELMDKRLYFEKRSGFISTGIDNDKEIEELQTMDIDLFKNRLLEFLNGNDFIDIVDIETNDSNSRFIVTTINGKIFEVQCKEVGD